LRGEIKDQGGGDAGTSSRSRGAQTARNPHQPEGWRRDGIPATPISPKGGGGTESIPLSFLLRDAHDIASSSLRELDAVVLATDIIVCIEGDT